MRFLHKQYQAKKKDIVEVEIDRPAKVKFMTAFDLKNYKLGRTYKYYGGTFDESPVRFVVPFDANWNVVVERGTHYVPLDVQAQCRLLLPDRSIYSSVALDAPDHVKKAAALESGEVSGAMTEDEGRSMS
jgi:uncharacterized protein DUF1883